MPPSSGQPPATPWKAGLAVIADATTVVSRAQADADYFRPGSKPGKPGQSPGPLASTTRLCGYRLRRVGQGPDTPACRCVRARLSTRARGATRTAMLSPGPGSTARTTVLRSNTPRALLRVRTRRGVLLAFGSASRVDPVASDGKVSGSMTLSVDVRRSPRYGHRAGHGPSGETIGSRARPSGHRCHAQGDRVESNPPCVVYSDTKILARPRPGPRQGPSTRLSRPTWARSSRRGVHLREPPTITAGPRARGLAGSTLISITGTGFKNNNAGPVYVRLGRTPRRTTRPQCRTRFNTALRPRVRRSARWTDARQR